jgi:hypothetical protein
MRKFLLLTVMMCGWSLAHATNCALRAGASSATVQAALKAMGTNTCTGTTNGSTVSVGAGSYNTTALLSIPCPSNPATIIGAPLASSGSKSTITIPGTSYTYPGPVESWTTDPFQSIFVSSLATTWQITLPRNRCTTSITIVNLEFNGNQPSSGGGGSIYFPQSGGSNVTLINDYFHGSWANVTSGHSFDAQVYIDGFNTNGGNVWTNVTISWNSFGSSTDCNPIMTLGSYQGGDYGGNGGNCDGLAVHSSLTNFNFTNNAVYHMEQCIKGFLGGNAVPNVYNVINSHMDYNDCNQAHRNPYEMQLAPQSLTVSYNSMHDMIVPGWAGWMFSGPQQPTYNAMSNVFISNTGVTNCPGSGCVSFPPAACECWGSGTVGNNLAQGIMGAAVQWGYPGIGLGPITISNNTFQMKEGIYAIAEYSGLTANQSGNVQTTTVSTETSVAPTISPASGSQSFPLTVTLTDAGYTSGALPQGNTGIWYTTDGSSPVPGAGTAKYAFTGQTIVVSAAGTVKAVGMWGAANQPTSYASGYGFVPSSVVTATYTRGRTPTAATPVLSPTNGSNSSSSAPPPSISGTLQTRKGNLQKTLR